MTIYVFDACALIHFKSRVPMSAQWDFFDELGRAVTHGSAHVPRAVVNELRRARHTDVAGAWATAKFADSRYPLEPDWDFVRHVMERAPDLVDPDATDDPADPYVLATAVQLQRAEHDPIVVTDDKVDRNPRISLATACRLCGVEWLGSDDFLLEFNAGTLML